jgi:hypothetical protein
MHVAARARLWPGLRSMNAFGSEGQCCPARRIVARTWLLASDEWRAGRLSEGYCNRMEQWIALTPGLSLTFACYRVNNELVTARYTWLRALTLTLCRCAHRIRQLTFLPLPSAWLLGRLGSRAGGVARLDFALSSACPPRRAGGAHVATLGTCPHVYWETRQ